MTEFPFDTLRRWPDFEAPELVAADAADRLLVETARQARGALNAEQAEQPVVVIGDNFGALTLGLLASGHGAATKVRVHQDTRAGELALAHNAGNMATVGNSSTDGFENFSLDAELVADARLVVMRLPKSLDQLEEWAALAATYGHDDLVVLAGGRDKYMTPSMNAVLEKYFDDVSAGLGVQKSRVLTARGPKRDAARDSLTQWPRRASEPELDLEIRAFGGVFAGASLDIGTRTLVDVLDRVPGQQNQQIIDFGCGTGVLAVALARLRPTASVLATDQSEAAIRSARATLNANGVADRVTVAREHGLASHPSESADLIVFNPPFHSGAAVHADTSLRLFAEAGRVLKPGGELWVVANRHLSYRTALRRLVGSTRTISQTTKFTVTASIKDAGRADAQRRIRRQESAPRGLPTTRRSRNANS